jgi:hypothetical protein
MLPATYDVCGSSASRWSTLGKFEAQGLTWYALAQRAAIPNQATIRDIEQGRDVKLSNLQAVATALGLELELVEVA